MKPLKQKFRHNPDEGVFGDCHRTAIATILGKERDSVPHFGDGGPSTDEFHARVSAYLSEQNLMEVFVAFYGERVSPEEVMSTIGSLNGDHCVYLLGGASPRGTNHTVVCRGSEVFSDPALDGGDIVGPSSDGYYYVSFLVPRSYA